ncbi:IS5-like element IS470 family transposase [Pilimelia columellifera subsp. columellifera]|uniref:IS5-like element IS470 family transposase n=2 Tax=Pilimelia TaxID=53370 RepID=A0ABN3NTW4_9ACTN
MAVLDVRRETIAQVARLLYAERERRGTREGVRRLGPWKQAVLGVRWMVDGTRVAQLARDNDIGLSTCYDYLNEVLQALAAQAPGLRSALLAAKLAGYDYVMLDGTLIHTDRVSTPGPTTGVDLWWSGKHHHHGGNVQVITAPDGWPLWTSQVRPGREHDTTALRTHPGMLDTLTAHAQQARVLGDLGYEGQAGIVTVAYKKAKNGELTDAQKQLNKVHNGLRAIGERGNALLKTTFKALRRVSVCPWKIGQIAAAALVLLHLEADRTT